VNPPDEPKGGTYAHVIRATRHKRGVRNTLTPKELKELGRTQARLVFAQVEIIGLFPHGLPEKRPRDLVKKVRAALAHNDAWQRQGYEPISRRTVNRAWGELLKP
jgi:hypothetical protein